MFEYAKGRFVQASRIIGVNIYKKQVGTSETDGKPIVEIRVAIDLDTTSKENGSVYAGPFESEQKAIDFIKSIPIPTSR